MHIGEIDLIINALEAEITMNLIRCKINDPLYISTREKENYYREKKIYNGDSNSENVTPRKSLRRESEEHDPVDETGRPQLSLDEEALIGLYNKNPYCLCLLYTQMAAKRTTKK